MSDFIQSLCIFGFSVISFINGMTLSRLQRQIDDLRHNDATLAEWVIHHDPLLYETWQRRHPTI